MNIASQALKRSDFNAHNYVHHLHHATPSLSELYYKYFKVFPAQNSDQRNVAFALRHQVYCIERGFEAPDPDHPGLEFDTYDDHAIQTILTRRGTDAVAGAVRLILPREDALDDCLPIQRICSDPLIQDRDEFPVERTGEISRFCISKAFRRRVRDDKYAEDVPVYANGIPVEDADRLVPHMTLGLIEQLVDQSIQHGLVYWCAEMEPTLLRLLTRLGIYFEPIGPLVVHHGIRQPCRARLDKLLDRVFAERRDVWEILSANGRHSEALTNIV
jgi:N-acyl amino acid synthase of PEP-CTERM/exosortase system